jgi:hypothetical protein
MDRQAGGPRRFHHKPYIPDIRIVPRLAVLLIAAVVALSLPASANGNDDSQPTSQMTTGSTLPRNVVLTLSEVKQVLPEMSQETATGEDETALGTPRGTRGVTYATDGGSRRVVISVAQYPSAPDAASTYGVAVQASLAAPGGSGEALANLGQQAFIGVSAQGDESHVGAGALYGELIVNVTLQGYDGTPENRATVTELIRMEAAAATRALQLSWGAYFGGFWSEG